MRRLVGLGVILSSGLIAACGSSSSLPDGGGTGGAAGGGGKAGATAGTTGQGGGAGGHASAGAGGQAGGGAGGQSLGGAGGQSLGGAGGQSLGGAGGQPAGGAGGQSAGGAGGQPAGGTGGQSAGGAGGHSSAGAGGQACLDPSAFSSAFTIADASFCAVAVYTAPEAINYQAPTWGSHGGPLVVQPAATGTGVTLERWTAPTGTTGAMTVQTTPVAAALPASTFLGAQALDLPFFGWTAISWTNPFPDSTGQFEMIASGAIATPYTVNGPYGVAALPAAASLGRLLYTGLSPLGAPTTSLPGLYAADACSSPAQALGSGTGCSASALIAAWGDNAGPVVADSDGDAFAVMTSVATGMQEARGFAATSVARGAAATTGVTLFTMGGFAGSLAALAPSASNPGLVVFQPSDSTTFDAGDVVQQKFTTTSGLAAMGTPSKFLTVPPAPPQGFAFLVDGSQRLWVAVNGASSTTYVVLARR